MDPVPARRAEHEGTRGEAWRAGLAAGLLGGVAMMAWMMGAAGLEGDGALSPLRAVGTTFRGEDASREGVLPVAWGIAVHLLVGGLLGVVFAAIVPRQMESQASVVLGAGAALFWLGFVAQVIIPRFAPVLDAAMPRHGGAWVIAYAVFGGVTGIAPWLRRRLGGRARRPADTPAPARPLRPRTSP